MKTALITGCSSGLGLALCKRYLKKGYKVYGISRNKPKINNKNFIFKQSDLSNIRPIKKVLKPFIEGIKKVMDINVFANKELLDVLTQIKVKNIIGISSGASVNGSFGWGAYCLSKSGLNMLINLYAKEMPKTKLLSIAPGVIQTPMTDIIRYKLDDNEFPSAKTLKNGPIQSPKKAAKRLFQLTKRFNEFNSGSFIDIRKI